MKIYFNKYLLLLVGLFVLSSCEEEERYGSQGAFTISLIDDLTGMMVTKSTPSELGAPLASQFNLQIKNTQTGALSYDSFCDKTYYEVPAATYDLFASYGENPILAFDAPYYKGELANQTVGTSGKNVVIPCSVGNALVSVKYVNQSVFDAVFTSYGIVATAGDFSLNWSSEYARKSVYFRAGSFVSFVFKGILKAGSKEVTFPLKQDLPETYKAKDHYTLRLTYQAGQSKLDITTEKKEATINETVPQDWLPKPSTESADFMNKVLIMKETMSSSAIINLKVARPLQDLKFKLELEDPNFESLNKEYLLSTLSEQDKVALEQAGIILPALGSSEPTVNMSGLTSKLQTINGGQPVNNYISINPKANNRWSVAEGEEGEKYTIQVEKPEFKVEVYPGNIWTKEFTATASVLAGNPEVLIPELKYEYSLDGNTWLEGTEKNTIRNLSSGNIYKMRVKYRDMISESTDVRLYNTNQIPNANMEDWYYRTDTKKWLWNTYYWYTYYPSLQNETDTWWATNNQRTTDWPRTGGLAFPVSYASTSAVSYIIGDPVEGNKCAEIRSMGSGSQYANTADLCYEGSQIAGRLFIGTYSWSDKETIQYGHPFDSKPTDFSFSYKYTPYGTDEFEAYVEFQNRDNGINVVGNSKITISKSEADSEWIESSGVINYTDTTLRITHMYILFVSSTAPVPSVAKNVSMRLEDVSNDWKAHVGSRLRIDNISLIYDK